VVPRQERQREDVLQLAAEHVERDLRAGHVGDEQVEQPVEKLSREACAITVGGVKFWTPASTSAPSACLDSLSPSIACAHDRSRATGSST
jgi:hypothetical protein